MFKTTFENVKGVTRIRKTKKGKKIQLPEKKCFYKKTNNGPTTLKIVREFGFFGR